MPCRISTKKQLRNAYYKKLLLTYYFNISVQAANLSDCRIESKKNRFGSENRIKSKLFCPNWNALAASTLIHGKQHASTASETTSSIPFERWLWFGSVSSTDSQDGRRYEFVHHLSLRPTITRCRAKPNVSPPDCATSRLRPANQFRG